MNSEHVPVSDSAFPGIFIVLSTFIGVLIWLCVMLARLQTY